MFECHVCKSNEASEELVNEVFQIDGKTVLVENIPAKVCGRCGELVFSQETTEKIRQMLHGDSKPIKSISVDVFAFN
jgi:HTH-type transcriptional regulator / antitoxin MqsA